MECFPAPPMNPNLGLGSANRDPKATNDFERLPAILRCGPRRHARRSLGDGGEQDRPMTNRLIRGDAQRALETARCMLKLKIHRDKIPRRRRGRVSVGSLKKMCANKFSLERSDDVPFSNILLLGFGQDGRR